MQNLDVSQTVNDWMPLANTLYVPQTVKEHENLVALLDDLIDEVGENESYQLASLIEVGSVLIENYKNENVPELSISE